MVPDTIARALAWAQVQLEGGESPQLDAKVLLAHCLKQATVYLHTWPEKALTPAQQKTFTALIEARVQGTPVAHLTGTRAFWTLDLDVSDATLIPRPDTEILVEHVLSLALPQHASVLDLGTGTGAIALSLASEHPDWRILACDKMNDAVVLAEQNRRKHGLDNVTVLQSDWFDAIDETKRFDVIVSNPPYVEDNSPWLVQGDVRFEPRSALTSGADGLDDIRLICAQAQKRLLPGGLLLLEHGYQQAQSVQALMAEAGLVKVDTLYDLNPLPRATVGYKRH